MKGLTGGHRITTKRAALVFLAGLAMVGVMATSGAAAVGDTTLISDDGSGRPSTGDSTSAAVNSDGRFVAFVSDADNLVPGDNNEVADVFVRDRQTGTIERASVSSAEAQATNGLEGSTLPSISSDGRIVAFASDADNLVAGDTNGNTDVFVRDRELGTTERVSVSSSEAQATGGGSGASSLSADGRIVAFASDADNLVAGDTNAKSDVFVRDRRGAKTTQLVSANDSGGQATGGDSLLPSISGSGRYVAFASDADNLVAGDTNAKSDVFVRDLPTGMIQRVSTKDSGVEGNGESGAPSISFHGTWLVFESKADNLVAGDTNGRTDVFARYRNLPLEGPHIGQIRRVNVGSSQSQAMGGDSGAPSIGSDGRYVAFASDADNLVAGDTNAKSDVFVHDLQTGKTQRVSVSSSSTEGNEESYSPSINSDGRFVAFDSRAGNLAANDLDGMADVFVHERAASGDPASPKVNAVTPRENATVTPWTNVTATFSDSMRPGSINTRTFTLVKDGTTTPVPATVTGATLDPIANLAPGDYTATVTTGTRDWDDNALDQDPAQPGHQPKTWRFTVGTTTPPGDTTAPTVVNVTPGYYARAVPAGSNVTATFNDWMKPGSINTRTFTLVKYGATTPLAAAVTYDAANGTATLDPSADLEPGTYTATVKNGARDMAGNQLDWHPFNTGNQPVTWQFTVPETVAPTVTETTPADKATTVAPAANVTATFSEAMLAYYINANTFALVKDGSTAPVAATVTYDAATRKATLNPSADLAPGTYRARVLIATRDEAGNQLDQNPAATGNQPKTWTFTVGS